MNEGAQFLENFDSNHLWNMIGGVAIKPLFELNRTATSVASSNNGMHTFSTTSTQKIAAECWRAKKITCKHILQAKNFIVNRGVEKKNS